MSPPVREARIEMSERHVKMEVYKSPPVREAKIEIVELIKPLSPCSRRPREGGED